MKWLLQQKKLRLIELAYDNTFKHFAPKLVGINYSYSIFAFLVIIEMCSLRIAT